jgi:hypothetical protein
MKRFFISQLKEDTSTGEPYIFQITSPHEGGRVVSLSEIFPYQGKFASRSSQGMILPDGYEYVAIRSVYDIGNDEFCFRIPSDIELVMNKAEAIQLGWCQPY